MSPLKIAYCDLRHRTLGLHSQLMPLQLGLLAAYAEREIDREIETRFFIDTNEYLEAMREWKPDVMAATLFCWNHSLTLFAARKTREALGDDVTVLFGGPDIEKNPKEQKEFLQTHPYVDIGVLGEGEKPFVDILSYVADGRDPRDAEEIKGAFFLQNDGETFVENPPVDKFTTLDEIPSPYLSGMFDEFFEQQFDEFKTRFGKRYASAEEEARRLGNFRAFVARSAGAAVNGIMGTLGHRTNRYHDSDHDGSDSE